MGLREFFKNIKSTPTVFPDFFRIPDANYPSDNLADPGLKGQAFTKNRHYFTVRVNEMYLQESRRWFTTYEPMVMSICEYQYDGQSVENPFVVGSSLLKTKMKGDGEGFVFRDTRVAGIHPYDGDRFIINMALFRNKVDNYLSRSIKFLENVSSVFNENIGIMLKKVTGISRVLMEAMDDFSAGDDLRPVFGIRKEFDPGANEKFYPGYYVMIGKSGKNWDPNQFSVTADNQLQYSENGQISNFRQEEYILFSVGMTARRNDYEKLPVYQSFEQIMEYAKKFGKITEDEKKKVQDMLRVLNFDMQMSPDLTETDAEMLMDEFFQKIVKVVNKKFELGEGEPEKKTAGFWEHMDEKIVAM